MGFQGYLQCWCECGNYWEVDHNTPNDDPFWYCDSCGKYPLVTSRVDTTNGPADPNDILPKDKIPTLWVCCGCGWDYLGKPKYCPNCKFDEFVEVDYNKP